jgi:hypothetical protein
MTHGRYGELGWGEVATLPGTGAAAPTFVTSLIRLAGMAVMGYLLWASGRPGGPNANQNVLGVLFVVAIDATLKLGFVGGPVVLIRAVQPRPGVCPWSEGRHEAGRNAFVSVPASGRSGTSSDYCLVIARVSGARVAGGLVSGA